MSSLNSCSSALASASVDPMNGLMPGRILICDGSRPNAAARARMSVANAWASCSRWCAVKIASDQRAANARPSFDAPACTSTGCPCGERGAFSAPCTCTCCPANSASWILAGSAYRPFSMSRRIASSSHESHSRVAASTNSVGPRVPLLDLRERRETEVAGRAGGRVS